MQGRVGSSMANYLKRCIFFCRRELIRNDQLIVSSLSIDKIELTGEGSQHARE